MIEKRHIESLLKINGLEPSAPEEEIRSVLVSARFKGDEVDAALMVLRENVYTKQTRVEGLHKVFRSDEGLSPAEISRLLGFDVDLEESLSQRRAERAKASLFQFIFLWAASLIIALIAILGYMYSYDIGLFRIDDSPADYDGKKLSQ